MRSPRMIVQQHDEFRPDTKTDVDKAHAEDAWLPGCFSGFSYAVFLRGGFQGSRFSQVRAVPAARLPSTSSLRRGPKTASGSARRSGGGFRFAP